MAEIKVRITAYKGWLVIATKKPHEASHIYVPKDRTKVGCTLLDTKSNLGISATAAKMLKVVRRSRDVIGEVMWFPYQDTGKYAFGWLGGPLAVISQNPREGDRNWDFREGEYVKVPNRPPKAAKAYIDHVIARDT